MCSPAEFYLGTTPLNESLVVMNKLVPMFKKKYNIEKLTFITLTDALQIVITILKPLRIQRMLKRIRADTSSPVIKVGKKQYSLGKSLYAT